jgi:hypothetical protein
MTFHRIWLSRGFDQATPPYVPVIVKAGTYGDEDEPVAEAWVSFNTTGATTYQAPWDSVPNYNWLLDGSASSYDIRYIKTAGTNDLSYYGLANNTWYNLNTNRKMGLYNSDSLGGDQTCTATVAIKYNANSTIISSNSIAFYAVAP